MKRRRRTAEQARTEILDAAEELLLAEGPEGVRLRAVADAVGMSHPGVLHHFGSVDLLLEALHRRTSRRLRDEVLGLMPAGAGGKDVARAIALGFERMADPREGRLLAGLLAAGFDPFPSEDERGLEIIAELLQRLRPDDADPEQTRFIVMLGVLAMIGESLVGSAVRHRAGVPDDDEAAARFRDWVQKVLARELARG